MRKPHIEGIQAYSFNLQFTRNTENKQTSSKIPQGKKQRNSKAGTFYKVTGTDLFNKSVLARDHVRD